MQNNSSEIVLISDSTFKSNPPAEFLSKGKNLTVPDSSIITVINDKIEFSNTPKANLVGSLSELDDVRRQITSRPLMLSVTCGKHVPRGQR